MLTVLVTCPPMLCMLDDFTAYALEKNMCLVKADVLQTLTEDELIALLPNFDGWIIGDDPATKQVLTAGKKGKLKACVKWGIGVDNVDFKACQALKIPITNTPMMFGREVSDVALAYVIGLSRQLHVVDRDIRLNNTWPKPAGISLAGKRIGVLGFGDIGSHLVKRLLACDMTVTVYDPYAVSLQQENVQFASWPDQISALDFLVFTCSLNEKNHHMLNADILNHCKDGLYVVNVARGPLIHEPSLIKALQSGKVKAAALDVFEAEPLPAHSLLRSFPQCIFGSHNGSNTQDAVRRASHDAINKLSQFFVTLEEPCLCQ